MVHSRLRQGAYCHSGHRCPCRECSNLAGVTSLLRRESYSTKPHYSSCLGEWDRCMHACSKTFFFFIRWKCIQRRLRHAQSSLLCQRARALPQGWWGHVAPWLLAILLLPRSRPISFAPVLSYTSRLPLLVLLLPLGDLGTLLVDVDPNRKNHGLKYAKYITTT